jgi:hypothetical protein
VEKPPVPEETSEEREYGRVSIPREWGELPSSAPYEQEVDWVYQNFSLVVVETKTSPGYKLKLGRAKGPAPSQGTIGLLQWAAGNRNSFFKDVVPKVKKGVEEDDTELVKRERKSIAEIKAMLERFKE